MSSQKPKRDRRPQLRRGDTWQAHAAMTTRFRNLKPVGAGYQDHASLRDLLRGTAKSADWCRITYANRFTARRGPCGAWDCDVCGPRKLEANAAELIHEWETLGSDVTIHWSDAMSRQDAQAFRRSHGFSIAGRNRTPGARVFPVEGGKVVMCWPEPNRGGYRIGSRKLGEMLFAIQTRRIINLAPNPNPDTKKVTMPSDATPKEIEAAAVEAGVTFSKHTYGPRLTVWKFYANEDAKARNEPGATDEQFEGLCGTIRAARAGPGSYADAA